MSIQTKIVGRDNGQRVDLDFYPTPVYVTEILLKYHQFEGSIWECACGDGRMSEVLIKHGYDVVSTDLIDRGYDKRLPKNIDFLLENTKWDNIVTNPPFELAYDFMVQGVRLANKCLALLLPIRYLTGKKRAAFYQVTPPPRLLLYRTKLTFSATKIRSWSLLGLFGKKGKEPQKLCGVNRC